MKEIVLQVQENEFDFVMKLLNQFKFIEVLDKPSKLTLTSEKMEVLKSIKTALDEVKLIESGKLPRKTLADFLAEFEN
jgi:hypothetical protein